MKKSICTLAIALLLLNACGKQKTEAPMTEQEALSVLNGGSDTQSRNGLFSKKPKVDYAQLLQTINTLAASGRITGVDGKPFDPKNLASLASVFNTFAGGNINSTFMIALSLLGQLGGKGGKIDLTAILQIISQASPIIALIAPQFAPIMQAILVILPLVQALLSQFGGAHAAVDFNWAYAGA